MRLRIFLMGSVFLCSYHLFGQDQEQQEPQDERSTIDTAVVLDLEEKEEDPTKKKKKPKKKVFYGIKTRKGFTRKGYGQRITYEIFFFLKKPQKPETFVRDVYW